MSIAIVGIAVPLTRVQGEMIRLNKGVVRDGRFQTDEWITLEYFRDRQSSRYDTGHIEHGLTRSTFYAADSIRAEAEIENFIFDNFPRGR